MVIDNEQKTETRVLHSRSPDSKLQDPRARVCCVATPRTKGEPKTTMFKNKSVCHTETHNEKCVYKMQKSKPQSLNGSKTTAKANKDDHNTGDVTLRMREERKAPASSVEAPTQRHLNKAQTKSARERYGRRAENRSWPPEKLQARQRSRKTDEKGDLS